MRSNRGELFTVETKTALVEPEPFRGVAASHATFGDLTRIESDRELSLCDVAVTFHGDSE